MLKCKWSCWWLLKNRARALFSICNSSEEPQYRVPFFPRVFCGKTFDGQVGGDDRTLWIFHGLGSRSTMICSSQLPGNTSLGPKKKKEKKMWQLDCSSVKLLCIVCMSLLRGGPTSLVSTSTQRATLCKDVTTSKCGCPCWRAQRKLTGNLWGKQFLVVG